MLRLSIIVPFYNVEKYIEECIRSLYDQDIPQEEYEVICVDDCSPDGSRAIVERLQKDYPTLQLICHEQNKRLGGARNTGLTAAKGQYIWFVDSDDYVVSNCFSVLLEIAEQDNLDILHFNFVEDRDGKIVQSYPNKGESNNVLQGGDLFFSRKDNWHIHYVVAWQKLYRRTFLIKNEIWFQEHVMYEDNEYAFRAFDAARRVKHVDRIAYVYRANPDSVTRGAMKAQHLMWLLDTSLSIAALIKELKDVRFAEAAQKYVQDTTYKIIWFLQQLPADEQRRVRNYFTLKKYLRLYPYLSRRKRYEVFTSIYVRR